jgi:protein-S-isoprenylcysteine O-methyltransferase Ste14
VACHVVFAVAIAAMAAGMYGGMTTAWGRVPWPWAAAANAALLAAFPAAHSFLLARRGRALLARVGPRGAGADLSTTTFALVASLGLALLFLLWTPSGIVWWRSEGTARAILTGCYVASWLLLFRSMREAGLALQTGALGWLAVARGRRPRHPPLPTRGLHGLCRQPIYVSFTLTTVTVPTWTPDQAVVAAVLAGYCVLGPRRKEARFERVFGEAFRRYRATVPYWLPWPRPPGRS